MKSTSRPVLFALGAVALVAAVLTSLGESGCTASSRSVVLAGVGIALIVIAELGVRDLITRTDVIGALGFQVLLLVASAVLLTVDCQPIVDVVRVATIAHAASLVVVGLVRSEARKREVALARRLAAGGAALLLVNFVVPGL
ncbi:MAG: hypothetical protein JWM86_1513 [Thermoleophilia bacterium]|nr:hypothetical protein [Thermoleophilia bacterium]